MTLTPASGFSTRAPDEGEQRTKQRVGKLLERDRARWMLDQPFLGSLSMRLDLVPVIDDRLPTAATDGERIFFNAHFAESLDAETRRFVLAHEIWHCAALHIPRRGRREPGLWNLAIDHETNSLLRQQGFKLPRSVVYFRRFAGMNAEVVYAALKSDRLDMKSRGPLADLHDPARQRPQDVDDPDNSPASDDPQEASESGTDNATGTTDGTKISQEANASPTASVIDPDYRPGSNPETSQCWPRQVFAAAQVHQRIQGKQPGWMKRVLNLVGAPSVPWQEVLRRFVERCAGDEYRWTRPNRRFAGQGLYLPSRTTTRLRLAVGLDVSGSTIEQIPRFMAELHAILRAFEHYEIRIVACDTQCIFDRRFDENDALPTQLELSRGGGGTDLQPVFDAIAEDEHAALVFLTDGWADPPQRPGYPVIWALTKDGDAPVHWGEVVRLDPP